MAKQKIVIKVTMSNAKSRAHAMALAVKASGVSSVEINGDLKDRLVVGGEGIDVVCLVNCLRENLCVVKCLRKKLCHAEILTVEEVKDKKPAEEKPPPEPKPCTCQAGLCRCAGYYPTPMVLCEPEEPPAGTCHIM